MWRSVAQRVSVVSVAVGATFAALGAREPDAAAPGADDEHMSRARCLLGKKQRHHTMEIGQPRDLARTAARLEAPVPIAVLDDAQGEGLGRAVWQVMREETPKLFWRSRHHNAVNHFYYAESDGCYKQEQWKVFWYGLESFAEIEQAVAHCAARVPTLVDAAL